MITCSSAFNILIQSEQFVLLDRDEGNRNDKICDEFYINGQNNIFMDIFFPLFTHINLFLFSQYKASYKFSVHIFHLIFMYTNQHATTEILKHTITNYLFNICQIVLHKIMAIDCQTIWIFVQATNK